LYSPVNTNVLVEAGADQRQHPFPDVRK
jgi:hypothetical protein